MVLILGGGILGIVVVKILSDNGINDFIILEGMEKIGGWMRKVIFYNIIIELGVNWI